jgi:KDO2-lipid IV(A) lauroyltransferase
MSRTIQYLQYLAVRVALCLLQSLRIETYAEWSPWLAWLCADVLKIRRAVIRESLEIAFPEASEARRRELTLGMWQHLFLLVAEVALAGRKIHETNWRRYLKPNNLEPLARLMLSDRPKLFLSGHLGNFEMSNYLLGLFGLPTLAVARELDNEFLDRFIRNFRARTGQRMVDKKGGYDDIQATLAAGGAVSMLADQYAGGKGCWVDFFGRPASTHKAIALLALEYEAPILVGCTSRLGRPLHCEMIVGAVLDPRTASEASAGVKPLTQWFTHQLEGLIRQIPAQYWWVHRRWKGTPPKGRKAKPEALATTSTEDN